MNLRHREMAFIKLGEFISQLFSKEEFFLVEDLKDLKLIMRKAEMLNSWFNKDNLLISLKSISNQLTKENFSAWTTPYNLANNYTDKKVVLVMAGNIPLVGFYDLLSVIMTGHKAVVKLSSNDLVLLPFLWKVLCKINPNFSDRLEYIEDLKHRTFDAVIATGSDNSSRYFEYYFKKTPSIIRKNRSSLAVITGKETDRDLKLLADDVFIYFGLGCRSVSKLFLPKGYDLKKLLSMFYCYSHVINHVKYANNYDYNKTILLMDNKELIENRFLIMKEDNSFCSPVSILYYEYYTDLKTVEQIIHENTNLLQCVVSKDSIGKNSHVYFGSTQSPKMWEYADNVDTIEFLKNI